jgi:two-component system, cell cycle sensor histidine kinase and response regulator CckA
MSVLKSAAEMIQRCKCWSRTRPRKALRVLIVDDEEPVRRFVDRVLREAGCETSLASDGPEALQVAATIDRLDLLVTDVMMPQMNGDELARQLRLRDPDLKVLYLTGYSDKLFKEKVMLWDQEAFLDKPCSIAGLLEAVWLLVFGTVNPDRAQHLAA